MDVCCENRPCGAPVELETCRLVRDGTSGRLVMLCDRCAPLFPRVMPERFTRMR